MKTILTALLLASLNASAYDFDDWTAADKTREAVYLAVDAVDWLQTRNIARNPERYYETNAILGQHPSIGRVNAYFASMMLVHVGIVTALPKEYRAAFQFTSIAYEVSYVAGNYKLGISAKF